MYCWHVGTAVWHTHHTRQEKFIKIILFLLARFVYFFLFWTKFDMHIEKVFFLLGLHKKSASLYDYMSLSFGAKHIMPNVMSITRNRNLFSIFVFYTTWSHILRRFAYSKKQQKKLLLRFEIWMQQMLSRLSIRSNGKLIRSLFTLFEMHQKWKKEREKDRVYNSNRSNGKKIQATPNNKQQHWR